LANHSCSDFYHYFSLNNYLNFPENIKKMKFPFTVVLIVCVSISVSAQWEEQISGTTANLMSVDFMNNDIGWVAGASNTIKSTSDGGQSWNNTAFTGSQNNLWFCIRFINEYDGYAVGSTYNYDRWQSNWARTNNGGNSWDFQLYFGNDYSSVRSIFFLNENLGWKIGPRNGEGRIWKTTTGISDWTFLTSVAEPLHSIWFVDASKGWCVGKNGSIYTTSDGGENWTSQNSGSTTLLKSTCFINTSTGWAAGYKDDIGEIIKTTDGGDTWYQVNYPPTISLKLF
jgi:photosystem II stability/assembly factor-like uncharacterized protein